MGRSKTDTKKQSFNISQEMMDWIEAQAMENGISATAQVNLMLAQSKRIIERQRELEMQITPQKGEHSTKAI